MWIVKLIFVGGCIAVTTAAAVASKEEDDVLDVSSDFSISQIPAENPYSSILGVIPTFRSCGGPAEALNWRYEGCMSSGYSGLCQIMADRKSYLSDFTFAPSESIPGGLGVRFNVSADDIVPMTYEFAIPKSAVKRGQVYTVRTAGNVGKELVGKMMTFQYIIFRRADKSVVACAEDDFDII